MKTIIPFLLLFVGSASFPEKIFSQEKRSAFWFGELHAGWQVTLNDRPFNAQIKPGYESTPFDSSKRYSAFFKNQVPVDMLLGINNRKGLQFQLGVSYYTLHVALSNPPDNVGNEECLFGKAGILSAKASALIDYASINGDVYNARFQLMGGFSTGLIVPLSMRMNDVTVKHFGISSFQKNMVWTLGLELLLNININKHWYVANAAGFTFPIEGNIGKIQMKSSSTYSAGDVIKINSFKVSTGIGIRF